MAVNVRGTYWSVVPKEEMNVKGKPGLRVDRVDIKLQMKGRALKSIWKTGMNQQLDH